MRLVFLDDDKPVLDGQDPAPRAKILPIGARRTPDWLTGPGDDLGAVWDDEAREAEAAALPPPVLTRPGATAGVQVEMEPGIEPTSAAVFAPPSTPKRDVAGAEAGAGPDAEARKPRRQRVSDPSAPWAPVASSVPVPKLSLVEPPAPEAAEPIPAPPPPRVDALPGRDDDLRRVPAAHPAPPVLAEPWWIIALDALRSSGRVQAAAAGVLVMLVVLGMWMWPRGVGTTPLSQIHRHPARYDGRSVVVRGRVGDDVFVVGTGWAFYLMQGRDTIAAFSLTRRPKPREVLTMTGQVSTGFLDGMPRQALFEAAK